jgi:hypothetical protein
MIKIPYLSHGLCKDQGELIDKQMYIYTYIYMYTYIYIYKYKVIENLQKYHDWCLMVLFFVITRAFDQCIYTRIFMYILMYVTVLCMYPI